MKRVMAHIASFAAGAALLAVAVCGAAAQDGGVREHRSVYPYPYSQPLAPTSCRKLCENDLSPCDPVEFKAADARCSSEPGNR